MATLPLDPRMAACVDSGEDFLGENADSPLAKAYFSLATSLIAAV